MDPSGSMATIRRSSPIGSSPLATPAVNHSRTPGEHVRVDGLWLRFQLFAQIFPAPYCDRCHWSSKAGLGANYRSLEFVLGTDDDSTAHD